tara:strand:+ start:1124 stop:1843 length:720 start_codon:yes stop_codon:yes gene_type:complete
MEQHHKIMEQTNMEDGYHEINESKGYLLKTLPDIVVEELNNNVNYVQQDFTKAHPYNNNLVGQIDNEYLLPDSPKLDTYLKDLTIIYELETNYLKLKSKDIANPFPLQISNKWVNFQKKYEYNPPHRHDGILSYVIWHKIPYNYENEINMGPGKLKLKRPSLFSYNGAFLFAFPDPECDGIKNIVFHLSDQQENKICIFPSNLSHQVFPFFSSNEYRISISGNMDFYNKLESIHPSELK